MFISEYLKYPLLLINKLLKNVQSLSPSLILNNKIFRIIINNN